ncbi:hypothetical protein OJ998_17490 [Solirubrobacter taibaiensis]|nr:hypothetical protein [Solirubrobacter taibaiensis]
MRRLLVVLILLLAAPAGAEAAEPACAVTGPEAKVERTLREEIRVRRAHGFRHDRAYVQRLIAAGPPSRRYGIRVTRDEDRYLDRWWRMDRIGPGAKLAKYLRRQTDVMDFWEVEDDWPRGPYVALYLKGDPARHRAVVKELAFFARSTRIVTVRYSGRDKDRIQRRIQREDQALERAGFEVIDAGSSWGVDRVVVEVVTKRKDAARYFAERYGPAVKVHVHERSTFDGCARTEGYEIAPDGMSLTVSWSDAPKTPRRVEVTEFADRVAVGIVVAYSRYPGFGDPGGKTVVRLKGPLGARPVYDASDGRRMRQRGPAPGAPPCPTNPREELTPLEQLAAERGQYGMNVDPAFLQTLIDADVKYTPEEQAWLELVHAAEFENGVHDYLHGGRVSPDWGGTTLVARYPEPPYLLVRFIRRFAFHVREMQKLTKVPVRFERSTVQRDWFYTLPLYIGDDARANDGYLEDFYVVQEEGSEGTQTVTVSVITSRPLAEAEAYFKGRYGGIVRVQIVGDRVECGAVFSR